MKNIYFLYVSLIISLTLCITPSFAQNKSWDSTRIFIKNNWKNVIHVHQKDSGTLIGLPHPYSVPGIGSAFQEMYYWDTYFTNVGLLLDGNVEQARNNVDNMLYLVKRYGFMPNGNRTFYLARSQSPYLSMMVRDVYEASHDKKWLRNVLPVLEQEYSFWMDKRSTPTGLNRYSGDMADDKRKLSMFASADKRLGISKSIPVINDSLKTVYGGHFIAECESGWDFTPRFNSKCADYLPVDLNCNLYMYEKNFAYFYAELNKKPMADWNNVAAARQKLMRELLRNPADGLFYDYDYRLKRLSKVYSAAVFNLLWSGVATKADAEIIVKNLQRLEANQGIAACQKAQRASTYQWDSPNGWANLQYVAIKGLNQYGYRDEATRIARKYGNLIATNFSRTGSLWEKYNVDDGTLNVTNEYKLPMLMGWTAGVFNYCYVFLNTKAK